MRQWMANGSRLGWLIDPFEDAVWVCREDQGEPEQIERPSELDCGDILPGLTIDFTHIESVAKLQILPRFGGSSAARPDKGVARESAGIGISQRTHIWR